MTLKEKVIELKEKKNAIILAHYYQLPEIQEVADFVGDSLALSQKAASTDAYIILFAGVHFMAETAKILNPNKKVLIPDMNAGCSLADSCPPEEFRKFKEKHPDHLVISYINCTAEIKAMTDIICTSSNALKIVNSIPKETPILFAPDKNLGDYVQRHSEREMILWDGTCMVHHEFSGDKIQELRKKHPYSKVIAHPECSSYLLEYADFIGSTKALLNFAKHDDAETYIVATESGILYNMGNEVPDKRFVAAPVVSSCIACQECPYMKMNTLEKLYNCLLNETPEIIMDEKIRKKALTPISRMLELS